MQTVITKGEYAARKGRKPSAVSNWIRDSKISAAALIGHGHNAKIWVEQADEDLARSLDPGQQAAQERPIMPATLAPVEDEPGAGSPPRSSAAVPPPVHDDLARRRRADADKAEHDAEAARRKLAQDEGRWVDAGEAQRAWARQLAHIVSETETFLATTLANDLADRFGLDRKAVAGAVRDAYRSHRAAVAKTVGAERAEREEAMRVAAE